MRIGLKIESECAHAREPCLAAWKSCMLCALGIARRHHDMHTCASLAGIMTCIHVHALVVSVVASVYNRNHTTLYTQTCVHGCLQRGRVAGAGIPYPWAALVAGMCPCPQRPWWHVTPQHSPHRWWCTCVSAQWYVCARGETGNIGGNAHICTRMYSVYWPLGCTIPQWSWSAAWGNPPLKGSNEISALYVCQYMVISIYINIYIYIYICVCIYIHTIYIYICMYAEIRNFES